MGLFTQEIRIDSFNEKFIIEKQEIELKKNKINLYVKKGLYAIIDDTAYKGQNEVYEVEAGVLGGRKKDTIDIYVYSNKNSVTFPIKFFGGQHKCSLSMLPKAKFDFAITGTADVMLSDYRFLAKKFEKSLKKEDVTQYLDKFRELFGREVDEVASTFITNETTEDDLKGNLSKIARETFKNGAGLRNSLSNDGLDIILNSISLRVNPINNTDEEIKKIVELNNNFAIEGLIDENKQKYIDRENEAKDKDRQHEIDVIRAKHTEIKETTTTVHNDSATPVINNNTFKYCTNCGEKIDSKALFCPNCGSKQ